MRQQKKAEPIWHLGQVNWFDPKSRKGSIVGDDGNMYRIQDFSEIKRTCKLKANSRVLFQLAIDSINPIIKTVKVTTANEKLKVIKPRIDSEKESVA